jgi:hypothetical protein
MCALPLNKQLGETVHVDLGILKHNGNSGPCIDDIDDIDNEEDVHELTRPGGNVQWLNI